jgi:hypothetical protein
METMEIISFINTHAGAEHFEQDKKLFKKLFPQAKILHELDNANQYNMKHLDERMLLQIGKCVCAETILENRGVIVDKKKPIPKPTTSKVKKAAPKIQKPPQAKEEPKKKEDLEPSSPASPGT